MATAPTNEAGLVRAIVRDIKAAYPDAWVFKVHGNPMQKAGVPDLLVALDGRLVGIEVKFQRPGESSTHAYGRVSELQWSEIESLRVAGCTADAVLSSEEALGLIREATGREPAS